jgi:AraC-like DNA-binding protein/TolB-like protein
MNSSSLNKLNDVVLEHLSDENFGPEQLAAIMGMSHSGLHRKIKQKYNKTISQVIREIRLEKARELLCNQNLAVSEVAYKVGFGSPTYFNKCFHVAYGTAPGEYRKIQENRPKEIPVEHAGKQNRAKGFPVYLYSISAVILAIIGIIYTNNKIFNDELPPEKTIAVLPVEYLGLPEYSYQGRGAHAAIVNHLSKIKDLVVFEKDSISYREDYFLSQQAGYYLKLTFLLEMKDILLYAKLMRGDNGQIIWSDRFPRKTEDVFDLYREVAEAVADKMNVTITPEEWILIERYSTPNLTAYDYYMQAKDLVWQYENTRDSLLFFKARNLLRLALKMDSCYAPAYAGLSNLYLNYDYWRSYFKDNPLDSALYYANKAIKIDKNLAEPYYIRGEIYNFLSENEKASSEYDKAIELNPNNWQSYYSRAFNNNSNLSGAIKDLHRAFRLCQSNEKLIILKWISDIYARLGFFDVAEKYLQEIMNVEGDSLTYFLYKGTFAFYRQKWERETEKYLLKAHDLDKEGNLQISQALSWCKLSFGEYEDALDHFLTFKTLMENKQLLLHHEMHRLGYLYWLNGNYALADQCFDQQMIYSKEIIDRQRPWWKIKCYDLAAVYAFRNERELAYNYLNYFSQYEFSVPVYMVSLIKYDSLFNSIRHEPEFQLIVKKVEAKYQAEHDQLKLWLIENNLYNFADNQVYF